MKTIAKGLLVGFVAMLSLFLLGLNTQNGQWIGPASIPFKASQKTYFCTPTGTGDCLSWDSPCSFRTALSLLSSSYTTTIYLSGGAHDVNNGVDATGSTISTNYVRIFGMNNELGNPMTRLINSRTVGAGGATHVLRVTGSYVSINNVSFFNSDQSDKNVISLNIRAPYVDVQRCTFLNSTGDGGGTGILVENNAAGVYLLWDQFFSVIDSGVEIGAATDIVTRNNSFYDGGKGLYISSASADRITIEDTNYTDLTTGVDYAAYAGSELHFVRCQFAHCVTNVSSSADWVDTWFESIVESGRHSNTYPTQAGVSVANGGGAAAWAWSDLVQIIPSDAITTPIKITGINFQSWTSTATYKIELFYGDATGDTSLGVFGITLGDPATKKAISTPIQGMNLYIPGRSYVGAKVRSSLAGAEGVTFCLAYEAL